MREPPPLDVPPATAPDRRPAPARTGRPPWLVVLTVGFALLLYCMPLADFDIWWHLKHGEWIVANARIPRVDLFTYGSLGEPYLDLHWGFQVFAWSLYALGGVSLLVVAKAAIGAATVAAGMASRPAGTPRSLAALAWVLPIHVHAVRNYVRPEIVTLLSIALTLWILRAASARPRLLWILPLLQAIALNCHAVAIANLGVVGAFAIERALRRRRGQALAGPGWRLEWAVLGAMGLAGLATPYGVEGLLFPVLLLGKISVDREFWSALTHELASSLLFLTPELLDLFVVAFFAQIALGVLSFALAWRDRRFDLYRLLLFAMFTTLALTAQRNVNLFAVVGGAVTLWNLAEWTAARPRVETWLRTRGCERAVAALLVGLVLSVVTGGWQRVTHARRGFGLGEEAGLYIHGPARFAGGEGMPRRAYVADYSQAGVYTFHNAPERLPFVDGRFEHPRRSTLEDYLRVRNLLADRAAMARGDRRLLALIAPGARSEEEWPAIVLDALRAGPQIAGLLRNPEWRLVFADRTGAVFLSRRLADRLGLPPAPLAPLLGPRVRAPTR